MAQDYDVDAWEIYDKLERIQKDEIYTSMRSEHTGLPDDVQRWVEVVSRFSLYNE